MKNFLIILLIALPGFCAQYAFNYRQDFSSSSLSATFPSSPQFTGPASRFAAIDAVNTSEVDIEINCNSTSQPSSNASNSWYIPAGFSWSMPITALVAYPALNTCYLRSTSGTISSGVLTINAEGY